MPEASLDITVERAGQLQQKIKLLDFRNCGIGSKTVTFSLGSRLSRIMDLRWQVC
jgi:hypothetical protein